MTLLASVAVVLVLGVGAGIWRLVVVPRRELRTRERRADVEAAANPIRFRRGTAEVHRPRHRVEHHADTQAWNPAELFWEVGR